LSSIGWVLLTCFRDVTWDAGDSVEEVIFVCWCVSIGVLINIGSGGARLRGPDLCISITSSYACNGDVLGHTYITSQERFLSTSQFHSSLHKMLASLAGLSFKSRFYYPSPHSFILDWALAHTLLDLGSRVLFLCT
jgi:hypothetical protein